ncbi:hypothetical protein BLNAU_15301 [Blattamonas nauphoetae]|uniref:Uncharacterized protein n=1 Tax=Blattamonas nauphoetae TaxID=2049346 RepID=A0ABQ9XEH1_9EUKA|nr:hypothetical protein BLNAU_15301 [Blattamonas nauphoetae]
MPSSSFIPSVSPTSSPITSSLAQSSLPNSSVTTTSHPTTIGASKTTSSEVTQPLQTSSYPTTTASTHSSQTSTPFSFSGLISDYSTSQSTRPTDLSDSSSPSISKTTSEPISQSLSSELQSPSTSNITTSSTSYVPHRVRSTSGLASSEHVGGSDALVFRPAQRIESTDVQLIPIPAPHKSSSTSFSTSFTDTESSSSSFSQPQPKHLKPGDRFRYKIGKQTAKELRPTLKPVNPIEEKRLSLFCPVSIPPTKLREILCLFGNFSMQDVWMVVGVPREVLEVHPQAKNVSLYRCSAAFYSAVQDQRVCVVVGMIRSDE